MKKTLAIALFSTLTGCMTAQVSMHEKWNPKTKPSYIDYLDSYWWGLKGPNEAVLQNACSDQKPLGIQRFLEPQDIAIGLVTLGIYIPVTVKIWCAD